jgi:hypothetical protein
MARRNASHSGESDRSAWNTNLNQAHFEEELFNRLVAERAFTEANVGKSKRSKRMHSEQSILQETERQRENALPFDASTSSLLRGKRRKKGENDTSSSPHSVNFRHREGGDNDA